MRCAQPGCDEGSFGLSNYCLLHKPTSDGFMNCAHPGCPNMVEGLSSYCPEHKRSDEFVRDAPITEPPILKETFLIAVGHDRELHYMDLICQCLQRLGSDRNAQHRVLRWVKDRYGLKDYRNDDDD